MRGGATTDNLFLKERASSLDRDILKSLGMRCQRIKDCSGLPDALFFCQLLLPICDPAQSWFPDDPRKPYYTEVTKSSIFYKHQTGIGSTYGHTIQEMTMPESVQFDGCLVCDGVLGGGDGAM